MDDHEKTKKTLTNDLRHLRDNTRSPAPRFNHSEPVQPFYLMDRISRIGFRTKNMEETLAQILGEILSFFDCDRSWFLRPCHPGPQTAYAPIEQTRAEWPGFTAEGLEILKISEMPEVFKSALAHTKPLTVDAASPHPVSDAEAKHFSAQSQMLLSLRPKSGQPWLMGIQHCGQSHVFTPEEVEVFNEIGLRITDILSLLISFHDMALGEKKYHSLFEATTQGVDDHDARENWRISAAIFQNTADAVLVTNEKNRIIAVNKAFTRITGYTEEEALQQSPLILRSKKQDRDFFKSMGITLKETGLWQGELEIRRKDEETFPAWLSIAATRNTSGDLINHVSIFSDITPLKRSQAHVDFLAFHDPLTHLPNRLLFNDRLSHSLKRAQRKGYKVALLFLDLDHFKTINDSLGHPVGDILLQQVAERIKSVVRQEDTVARLSGDEFVVIVDRIEPQGVTVLAHKLMATFTPPFVIKSHELHVTISMGITIYPKDGEDNATLIKNADTAMYQAKEEGRNNYALYTPALTTAVFKRLTLETELHRAIKNNELVLYYQPQYSMKTGELAGAEALIRWRHPKLGLIAPAQFIPYAEESDLIVSIGKWVLQTACIQTSQWRKAGLMIKRVSVNISGSQFLRGEIVKIVRDALKKSQLKPEHLELEITESFFMKNTKWMIKALGQLKTLGVSIAIDDFGTGYYSLSYLKRLPVDKLKIDRSFIRDLPGDINDKAIAQAVLTLAHGLHHKVTAEGVETEDQKAYLKLLGCDESQGFLYSPPVSAEKFADLL